LTRLPHDSPYAHILRVHDIARYIGVSTRTLLRNACGENPADFSKTQARELTKFFQGWDSGQLVKALIGTHWRIVERHSPLAQVVAASRPAMQFRVSLTNLGPKLIGD